MREHALSTPLAAAARRHLFRDVGIVLGLSWLLVDEILRPYQSRLFGYAFDYWSVNLADQYTGTVGAVVNFAYAPPLALAFGLLGHLPFWLFVALWTAMNVALVMWLARPRPWLLLVLAVPIVDELVTGQIELLLATCVVVAFERSAAWTLPLLAKSTSGVGCLWFLVRREWRSLAQAIIPAAVLLVVALLIEPSWLSPWLASLRRGEGQDTELLPVRVVAAAALVVWGARANRPWSVLAAATLALPVIYVHSLSMLLGLGRLLPRSSAPAMLATAVGPGTAGMTVDGMSPHGGAGMGAEA